MKIFGLTAGAAAAWKLGLAPRLAGLAQVSVSRGLMGTIATLTVVGEDRAAAAHAVEDTLARMRDLEGLLSRHRAQSELSQLNGAGSLEHASAPLLAVLRQARQVSEETGGAFDVTVKPLLDLYLAAQGDGALPSEAQLSAVLPLVDYRNVRVRGDRVTLAQPGMGVTLDGIAKGYIVDEGVSVLRARGFHNVLVEAGGDLLASGRREPDAPWTLGVQAPRATGELATRFQLQDRAVATSGDYMHTFTADYSRHHILDPRQGVSPAALSSVSVVADTACRADALSTALMVLGPRAGLALVERLDGVEALLIDKSGAMQRSAGFPPASP